MWINTDPYEPQEGQMPVQLTVIQPHFPASQKLWAQTLQVKEPGLEFHLGEPLDLRQGMIKWDRHL